MKGTSGQEHEGLKSKTVLIIGGSGGIGAEIARLIACHCRRLILHGGHDADKLDRLRNELVQSDGPECAEIRTLLCPLEDQDKFLKLIDHAASIETDIDVCIFCAGPVLYRSLHETLENDWRQMIRTNLELPGIVASKLIPGMLSRNYGRFLFFGGTGTSTIGGYSSMAAYNAAKTGLSVLVKSIAKSYLQNNISATMLCPGVTFTEYYTENEKSFWSKKIPADKRIDSVEIAEIVLYILKESGTMLNGSIIDADKGFRPGVLPL